MDDEKKALPSVHGLTLKQMKQTFGNSGTDYWSGYFMEEPNSIWRDEQRVEIVEEMRRTDSSVKAALSAVKTPILSAEYFIEPATEDERDVEIAKEIENQLFGMRRSFQNWLREALTYLDFGHAVFEKIWIVDERGMVVLKDLAPRIQHSILKWEIGDRQKGITQYSKNNIESANAGGNGVMLEIPWKKLFILTNEQEGDDVTGQSILRAAYRSYYIKTSLYKLQSIAIERGAVGIPVGEYPIEASESDKTAFENALKNIRANQQAYITHKPGYKISFVTPQGNPMGQAIKDGVDHHSRMILLTVLAQFLDLGAGDGGSFALSKDQSGFFLQNLQEKADYIAEQINFLIQEIVDYNYKGIKVYPTFRFEKLGNVDFTEISNVVKTLVDAGLVSADDRDIQQFMRNALRLPEMDEETQEETEAKKLEDELNNLEMGATEFDFADEEDEEVDGMEDEEEIEEEKTK